MNDVQFMQEALAEAMAAYENGEYPVGAIIVSGGEILSRGRNAEKTNFDPTAHAEIRAIRNACERLQKLKLEECTLYTTLYPCPMCESTIVEVGIRKVVYGARPFQWIREVKYGKATLEMIGPILVKHVGAYVSGSSERWVEMTSCITTAHNEAPNCQEAK